MLELIGLYIVVTWLFSHPLVIGGIVLFMVIAAIGGAIADREEQPINKELRGMTREQRADWAMRRGPYSDT